MSGEFIISLDVGSSKIKAIVAEINSDGSTDIVGVGTSKAEGLRRGSIINIDQAVQSIRKAVQEAEQMVGIEVSEVYVGITGNHISLQSSHGVVAISNEDREICVTDIDRVLQAARVVALPPERAIIEVVPKQFIVDGLDDIKDPNGMIGVRLEVEALIVTGAKTMIYNLLRCVEKANLNVAGMVFLPLAVSEFCLSKDEKNLGVVLVDIGGGTTTVTIFQDGHLKATSVIPIGGEYITNDIAIGLRISTEEAEEIKVKHGSASTAQASIKDLIPVKSIGATTEKMVSQVDIAQIIEPRVEEICGIIQNQVREMGYTHELPGGYVLTGGVMALPDLNHTLRKYLHTVRIAVPHNVAVKEPGYIGGVSMIKYLQKGFNVQLKESKSQPQRTKKVKGPSAYERVKTWLSEFI